MGTHFADFVAAEEISFDFRVATDTSAIALATATADAAPPIKVAAAPATTPAPTPAPASSELVDTINYLLDNVLGFDRSNKLVQVTATPGTEQNKLTVSFNFSLGSLSTAALDLVSFVIDTDKLKHDRNYVFNLQEEIAGKLKPIAASYVDKLTEGFDGPERALVVAANGALKDLVLTKIMEPLSGLFAQNVLDLDLPDRGAIADILGDAFDGLGEQYFKDFLSGVSKTYAKLGLAELLTNLTSGLDPEWATAIHTLGNGVFGQVLDNILTNYFAAPGVDPIGAFDNIEFSEQLGTVLADLLIDFKAIDREFLDDVLGLDGGNWIETQIGDFLSHGIRTFVQGEFVNAIDFLGGDFGAFDLANFFSEFAGSFDIASLLGRIIGHYDAGDLAELFVNIDSLPEQLVSDLGSWIGSSVLGDVIGSFSMDAVAAIFGQATANAIGTTIFNGLGSLLGAGVGAIAGSIVFELLDNLFDGALSGIIGDIWDWIQNDSPQAFSGTHYDPATHQFVEWYFYHKDSNGQLDNAVKTLQRTFTEKLNEVIGFIGQPASFDSGYDNIMFAWGKKHFNESFASYIGSENNKISYKRDGEIVLRDTLGAALAHMNFHDGDPIIAKAYDLWKADVLAGGGALQSYISSDAFQELQDLIGLAKFANDYRQNSAFYDALMAGDAPIGVTILQQYLEAEALGFNDATVLHGASLGTEQVNSAAAGDVIHLDGAAWMANARGGDDTVYGSAIGDIISGGTGNDQLFGNNGNDDVHGDEGNDKIYGGDGNDSLFGDAGDDLMLGDRGDDRIHGGDGADQLFGYEGNDFLYGDAGNDRLTGEAGDDFIDAGDGDDLIYGDSTGTTGRDEIHAGAGDDQILAGDGHDLVLGDAGDDLLDGGLGDDTIDGGAGIDTVNYAQASGRVEVDLGWAEEQNTISAGVDTLVSIEIVLGSAFDDRLSGGVNADRLQGGTGADMLYGRDGADSLWGGTGDDLLDGGEGDDTLWGGDGNDTASYASAGAAVDVDLSLAEEQGRGAGRDTLVSIENLIGSAFADRLAGDAGANQLRGGAGNDVLIGRGGNDTLFGGDGADLFVFGRGSGADTIADFAAGTDRIDLSAYGFASFAQLQAAMTSQGGATSIALGGGNSVTLTGVAAGQLGAGDFILSGGDPFAFA